LKNELRIKLKAARRFKSKSRSNQLGVESRKQPSCRPQEKHKHGLPGSWGVLAVRQRRLAGVRRPWQRVHAIEIHDEGGRGLLRFAAACRRELLGQSHIGVFFCTGVLFAIRTSAPWAPYPLPTLRERK